MVPSRIQILVKPGFGGLIQGQIYNPVPLFLVPEMFGWISGKISTWNPKWLAPWTLEWKEAKGIVFFLGGGGVGLTFKNRVVLVSVGVLGI